MHMYVYKNDYYYFVHVLVHCRIAKENRIFGGLWYGTTKPDMSLFLKPLADALSKLVTDGWCLIQKVVLLRK